MTDRSSRPLVILGAGYTSRFLYPHAKSQGWHAFATSRTPEHHLPHVQVNDRIQFDLMDEQTWSHVPAHAHLIWCFPAIPGDMAERFIQQQVNQDRRIIILGSTSAYGKSHPTPVDESTPLDHSLPRVQSEEHLRRTYGAVILRLAGLYGPGRHVLDWMRKGKVKNTNKYVNLIHIEDVAALCLSALEHSGNGEDYVISDGIPRQWSEVFSVAEQRWGMAPHPLSETKQIGKRLTVTKMKDALSYSFRHPDLYKAIDEIENSQESIAATGIP